MSPAELHIELLTGAADTPMHFRCLHDSDDAKPAIKRFGVLPSLQSELTLLQSSGYGVFIVVNEGGNLDSDITGIRAVFVDADGIELPSEWHLEPDFIVQRDATHWHAYWRVTGCPVERFREIQKQLAAHYGTDRSVCNPSRVMRLAGSQHLKSPDNPTLVTIRRNVGGLETWELGHTVDYVLEGLAVAEERAQSDGPSAAAGAPVDAATLRQAVGYLDPDVSYPDWSRNVAAIGAANCLEARDIAHEYSEGALDRHGRFKDIQPLSFTGHEAVDLVLDTMPPKVGGVGVGTIEFLAHQAGWAGTLATRPSAADRFAGFLAKDAEEADGRASEAPQYRKPMTISELASGTFTVPYYAWDGLFLAEHVNLNAGDGGAGKTFLLQQSGVATAAGLPLFGRATRQMPVLLVLAEDDHGATQQRLNKICEAMGVAMEGLPLYLWCLPGQNVNIATVADDGTWAPGPFMEPLRAQLAEIGRPALVGIDTVADIAALDETKRLAVNTFCKQMLGSFCRDFAATVVVNAHPSKAAMADGSGYAGSTAWNNAVRSRLTLERPDSNSNKRILKVAKANYGDNAELELHLVDGVFWPRDQGDAAASNDRLMDACVAAALAAAEQGTPVQMQRRPPRWVLDEVEKAVGRRPSVRELREVLSYAQRAQRIRFVMGTSKRVAGYYPWDEQRAAELAVEAKRHASTVEALSAAADQREANNE